MEAALASTTARERLMAARQVAAWHTQEKSVTDPSIQVNGLQRSHSKVQLYREELFRLQAEMFPLALSGVELKRLTDDGQFDFPQMA